MIERTRDDPGNTCSVGATFWPDHTAPLTWHRCVAAGCDTRVDPWDHNTRCATHRPAVDDPTGEAQRQRRREVVHAIVTANRKSVCESETR